MPPATRPHRLRYATKITVTKVVGGVSAMVRRVQVHLTGDLDGSSADETVMFGLDGPAYEIDLSKKNAAKLRATLTSYIDAGRKAGRVSPGSAARVARRAT